MLSLLIDQVMYTICAMPAESRNYYYINYYSNIKDMKKNRGPLNIFVYSKINVIIRIDLVKYKQYYFNLTYAVPIFKSTGK